MLITLPKNMNFSDNLRAMNHAVVAVGYTASDWELRNSWGSGWGNGGYFTLNRRRYNNIGSSLLLKLNTFLFD